MPDTDSNNEGSEVADRPFDDTRPDRPAAEARQYLQRASEQPEGVREERARLIELLSPKGSSASAQRELERRAAASGALAKLARDDPTSLEKFLPALVEELRKETGRELSDEESKTLSASRTIRNHLVWTISCIIVNKPETATEFDAFADFVGAVTTDLDNRALQVTTKALFASADERSGNLASATELLSELLTSPDEAIQAWSAGTVGRVAEEHPDAVASTADNLRCLLTQDDETVQHNAVEALAALVRPRPDIVVPAADALRNLLDHDEVAIQHNAAGVLGWLAKDYPDAVIPAVEDLFELRGHDDEAVQQIATGALTRLAHERPEAVADW